MVLDPGELVSERLNDRYTIIRIIGHGAMGYVYEAWDPQLGRSLAIKILLPKEATEFDTNLHQNIRERFHREGVLIQRLRHKHIVSVYEVGEWKSIAYLVMHYFNGGTLREKIKRQKTLPLLLALKYIKQAAAALELVHFYGIVHRDVKPQNFLLDENQDLVLSDFGVAHLVGSTLTKPGELWGTEAYASPQVKSGDPADPRDDIYSLGVVLYEMLTGNHPGMVNKPHPAIPSSIAAVIRTATAFDRDKRYASAPAMAQALDQAIKNMSQEDDEEDEQPGYDHSSTTLADQVQQAVKVGHRSFQRVRQRIETSLPPSIAGRFSHQTSGVGSGSTRASFYLALSLIGVFFIGVLGIFIYNASHQPATVMMVGSGTTSSAAAPQDQGRTQAEAAVQNYYNNWNNKQYQKAYDLLSTDYKKNYTLDQAIHDYEHATLTCPTIQNSTTNTDGTVTVTVTVDINETSGSSTVTNRYIVTFLVAQEQGQWKLTPSPQSASNPGTCQ